MTRQRGLEKNGQPVKLGGTSIGMIHLHEFSDILQEAWEVHAFCRPHWLNRWVVGLYLA